MDRHLGQVQLLRRFPPRVTDDDYSIGIDHDGLAKAELGETGRHGVDRVVVDARVGLVGPDVVDGSKFYVKHLRCHDCTSMCVGFV